MDSYEAKVVDNTLNLLREARDALNDLMEDFEDPKFEVAHSAIIDAMAQLENLQ